MSLNKSKALEEAKEFVLQQNLPAAVKIYREIIEDDPSDLDVITTLGDLYANSGRVSEAIALFSSVATMYAGGGFTRKAIVTFKKIITLDPGNYETAVKLADLYAEAGLPSEARQHYLQIAEALSRQGQMLDALMVLKKVVDLDPLNIPNRIKLGELYLREGLTDQAFEAFVDAAQKLAAKGESRRALNAYQEALAIKADDNVVAETRKLMTELGVVDQEKTLRSLSQPRTEGNRQAVKHTAPLASEPPRPVAQTETESRPSDSFVIQEISKAEILVAYGKVEQAIGMLRSVLKDKPDDVDLHVKLKDIYLRNGMMTEAARECFELERIHESRGESERARDYAVRASRLTQLIDHPSGDLVEQAEKPAPEPQPQPQLKPAPQSQVQPQPSVPPRTPLPQPTFKAQPLPLPLPTSRPQPTPQQQPTLQPQPTNRPQPTPQPQVAAVKTAPAEVASRVRTVTTRMDTRPAPMAIAVTPEKPAAVELETISDSDFYLMVPPSDTALTTVPAANLEVRESTEALVKHVITQNVPMIFADAQLEKKHGRATALAIAAGVAVVLSIGAVIGGFAYDSQLDKQYQALSLAAPSLKAPTPPAADEPQGDQTQEAQQIDPISVVVTAPSQPESAPQPATSTPQPTKSEPPPTPQPVVEAPKARTPAQPAPPRASIGPDGRGIGESSAPTGLSGNVPTTNPVEPPPKVVRQSPGVVLGSAIKKVDPVYPSAARSAHQTGAVAVEVVISEHGDVTSARAVSGPELLRSSAVAAAKAWKFKASTLGGVPVTTTTTIVFNFKF
jgi:TonB family protein